MRHALPESYVNLLVGTEALAAWEPSGNLLEGEHNNRCCFKMHSGALLVESQAHLLLADITNVVGWPKSVHTAPADGKSSHQPVVPVTR